MEFRSISTHSLVDPSAVEATAELECLGDEIAELAAHLTAATARLLDLIREFDARGGWNSGFRSCAAWLTWRIGLSPIAAREHVRVARALATLPTPAQARRATPSERSAPGMTRRAWCCTRTRRRRGGWASRSTWATRWTSCIRWPSARRATLAANDAVNPTARRRA
jgi:hypothetical protein